MPVKHIVMFGFQEGSTPEQINEVKNGLLLLPSKIPQIISYQVGEDLCLTSGQNHPAGKNRVLCWTATFTTADDYNAYNEHPAHVQFLSETLKPILLPGSRAAIQYEFGE